jgi:hypothetical protein
MSSAPPDTESSTGAGQQTGYYVYGILPGDVELTEKVKGIGDREVTLVHDGELAALVSEIELFGPLGTTEISRRTRRSWTRSPPARPSCRCASARS